MYFNELKSILTNYKTIITIVISLIALIISIWSFVKSNRREKYKDIKISPLTYPGQHQNYEIKIDNQGTREFKIIEYGVIELKSIHKKNHKVTKKRESRPITGPPIRRVGETNVYYNDISNLEDVLQIRRFYGNLMTVQLYEEVVFETLLNSENIKDFLEKNRINKHNKLRTYIRIDTSDIIISEVIDVKNTYGFPK